MFGIRALSLTILIQMILVSPGVGAPAALKPEELPRLEAATAAMAEADALQQAGDFEAALQAAQRAYDLRLQALGPEHPLTLESQTRHGNGLIVAGKIKRGVETLEKSLEAQERVMGIDHANTHQTRFDVVLGSLRLGRFERAREILQPTIERLRAKPPGEELAKALGLLGWTALREGKLTEFEANAWESYALYKQINGERSKSAADALRKYAISLELQGNCLEAEQIYQEALDIFREVYPEDHPELANMLNSLSSAMKCLNDFVGALEVSELAARILEAHYGADSVFLARHSISLASLHEQAGNLERAGELHRQAVFGLRDRYGEDIPAYTVALANYGIWLNRQEKFEEARDILEQAVALRAEAYGAEHYLTAQTASTLGTVLFSLGEKEKGLKMQRDALAVLAASRGREHLELVYAYNRLAWSLGPLKDDTEPMELALMALKITQRRSLLSFQTLPESRKVIWLEQQRINYDLPLSLLVNGQASADAQLRAVWEHQILRKNLTVSLLAGQQGALEALGDQDLLKSYEQMVHEKAKLARFTYQPPQGLAKKELDATLAALEERIEQIEEMVSRRSVAYAIQQNTLSTTLQHLLDALPEDSALIDFYKFNDLVGVETGDRYGAFVAAGENVQFVDLGPASVIESWVHLVREAIGPDRSGPGEALLRGLEGLHHRLISPLQLPREVDTLFLIPDGSLHILSFDALRHEGEWLMNTVNLRVLSNATDLVAPGNTPSSASGKDVIFADPAFNGEASLSEPLEMLAQTVRFLTSETLSVVGLRSLGCAKVHDLPELPLLPGTSREARLIRRQLRKSNAIEVHLRNDATVARVLGVRRPRVLHLATHGFFLGNCEEGGRTVNPLLLSGLAFTGANQSDANEEAAFLTAYQASQLDLRHTSLVVLSACDTGAGVVKADGLHGLRRAFEHAGAATIVTSLWPVPDQETGDLMSLYYGFLADGMGKVTALQEAKKVFRRQIQRRLGTDSPFYWAGFVATGQDRPLPGVSSTAPSPR